MARQMNSPYTERYLFLHAGFSKLAKEETIKKTIFALASV